MTSVRTSTPARVIWVGVFLFVPFGFATWRLGALTIRDHAAYASEALKQRSTERTLSSERGEIFFQDRFGNHIPAALNREVWAVAAAPRQTDDIETAARGLAPLLGFAPEAIRTKLSDKSDPHRLLHPGVTEDVRRAIEALNVNGISLTSGLARSYPARDEAAFVTGFFGFREGKPAGQYGIEEFYETELKGREGAVSGERDTLGRIIFSALTELAPARHGTDIILTIDPNVQAHVVKALKETIERWQAVSASALVLEPKTGRILAMAAWPSYDPNEYKAIASPALFMNPLVQQRFEPGSVFKPLTMAAALEGRAITPETTYDDPGEVKFGNYVVRNFDSRSHGVQTMTQVLEKSLNTGAIFAMRQAGKEEFLETVKAFGFGEKTGVEIAGEVVGDMKALETFSDLQFATASFGQGIAVTPVALARAIAAIANGGKLMTPHVVQRQPQVLSQAISEETARTLTRMLVSVVDNGPGYKLRAKIPGYALAGKTGTAQIPDAAGGYSQDVIHSFVGFGPASDPKFLVLLKMDRPTAERFAANTLTLSFRDIAKFLIEYYEIPPDRAEELETK